MLGDLIVSKCRIKLLQIFLAQPNEIFYIRQLVRATGEEVNAVRRQLNRLERSGIVKKETRGNRIYYWIDKNYPLFGDLLSLFSKTVGLGGAIVKNKNKIGKVSLAMLSGRFARGLPTKQGAVDLLVVGQINLQTLAKIIREEEQKIGREINYTVMTKEELNFRKKHHDPFLLGILTDARIILIGNEMDLVE
ncbi:MAG: winged helix-turn-helix domain-containing protein [Microgenomates group bacterium]